MDKLILHISIIGCESVRGQAKQINFITFDGYADGGLFEGKISPAGTDVQEYTGGAGKLCARYMLTGHDYTGKPCRIYIENKAATGSSDTKPEIVTDSEALVFLETAALRGRLFSEGDKLTIEISCEGKKQ